MLNKLKQLNLPKYDCDFIDIRIEQTRNVNIMYYQKELYWFQDETKLGAFIRVYKDKMWYYVATTDVENLESELKKLLSNAGVTERKENIVAQTEKETILKTIADDYVFHWTKEAKIEVINKMRDIVENDPLVLSVYTGWTDIITDKYYINTKGISYYYDKAVSGMRVGYDLKDGDDLFQTGFYKAFQKKEDMGDMESELRDHFAEGKLFIKAPTIEPGKYPVVLSPHATGIFAHESFGHKSEADWMIGDETMKAEWVIGKKVANEKVSIVDVGDDPKTSGYCPIDDEGNISEKTYLIKNGILTGRLHNEATAKLLEEAVTGNARAINFEYEPIVRMTNTYFEAGELSFDELIKPIKKGYFIKKLSHGSGMSTFTLAAEKAYLIENGKLSHPVKINIATGTVFQTLHDIDGLTDKIEIDSFVGGGCGKMDQQGLPVAFGGPYIRVKEMSLS